MTSEVRLECELGSDEGAFLVTGVDPPDGGRFGLPPNTLVEEVEQLETEPSALMILTGSQWGPFAVTVRTGSTAPPIGQDWEDAVEVSVRSVGEFTVGEVVDGPVGSVTLPPGNYRMRISARGRAESDARDRSFDDPGMSAEALEQYLVELWPADPSPSAVVRETSQSGARAALRPGEAETDRQYGDGERAARVLLDAVQQSPEAQKMSGAITEVSFEITCAGSPTRVFNRVIHASGWPPCLGASGSGEIEVGATTYYDASSPDDDSADDEFGWIRTTIVEVEKPRHLVKAWNWLLPEAIGLPKLEAAIAVLERDALVTMEFEGIRGGTGLPQTVVRLEMSGFPVEWAPYLRTLWIWDVTRLAVAH